jgi:hypothetical protein
VGGGSLASATYASVQSLAETAGTISGFGANISAALGLTIATNNVVVLTWYKNTSPQAVTCTITNPSTTCADASHSFTYTVGDTLAIQAVFTGTITATPIWVMNAGINVSAAPPVAGSFVLLEQHTASTSASLDFTTCISSTYDDYVIELIQIIPDTGGLVLYWYASTNGSTYDTGNNYSYNAAGSLSGNSTSQPGFPLTIAAIGTSATSGLSGSFRLYNPLGSNYVQLVGQSVLTDGSPTNLILAGKYNFASPVLAFRIAMSSGNIVSGTVRVYGLAK